MPEARDLSDLPDSSHSQEQSLVRKPAEVSRHRLVQQQRFNVNSDNKIEMLGPHQTFAEPDVASSAALLQEHGHSVAGSMMSTQQQQLVPVNLNTNNQSSSSTRRANQTPSGHGVLHHGIKAIGSTRADYQLQDVPIELLQVMIINAVVDELKDLKLAKKSWNEEVNAILERMKKVSDVWRRLIKTTHFSKEIERRLQELEPKVSLEEYQELRIRAVGVQNCNILRTDDEFLVIQHHSVEFLNRASLILHKIIVLSALPNGNYTWTTNELRLKFYIIGAFFLQKTKSVYVGGKDGIIYKLNSRRDGISSWREVDGLKRLCVSTNSEVLCLRFIEEPKEYELEIHSGLDYSVL